MATKVKADENKSQEGKVLSFNTEDYVVIELLKNGKKYAEHKFFAEKLVSAKKAKIVKDADVEKVVSNTTVLPSNKN